MVAAVSARIRACAEGQGFNQAKLAGMTGMSKQVMSKYWNGHSAVPADRLFDIADALKVSARWLQTGEGSSVPPIEADDIERQGDLSADEAAMVASYRLLQESNRIVVKAVADAMLGRLEDTSHPLMQKGDPAVGLLTLHAKGTAFRGEGDDK